jgi:hypothetical protein
MVYDTTHSFVFSIASVQVKLGLDGIFGVTSLHYAFILRLNQHVRQVYVYIYFPNLPS